MSEVSTVREWMASFGWTNEGRPGARKTDVAGKTIARHGDDAWITDVEDAYARFRRLAYPRPQMLNQPHGIRLNGEHGQGREQPEPRHGTDQDQRKRRHALPCLIVPD